MQIAKGEQVETLTYKGNFQGSKKLGASDKTAGAIARGSEFVIGLGSALPSLIRGAGRTAAKSSAKKGGSAAEGGSLVKIGTVEEDVMMFSSKIGTETVEGITNFTVKDGKLYLNQLHLQGSSAGSVGREALWNMAKDLGKQYNVKEVIIQGGKRTTGKYKGTVPSPITIKLD